MVRKLEIIWQAGVFNYPQWLARWLQRMFQLDKEGFDFSIYCSHATSASTPSARSKWAIVSKDLHAICAGPPTYNAVHQVIRPRAGHHLQLVTLDLGPCHTWPGNNHRPESGASTTLATIPEEQPMRPIEPRSQTLAAWRTGSRPSPTWRHANPIPEELEAHRTGNPSTNHGRWVEQKLAEGRRHA
ncbi:hypothetical protein N7451_012424 [Penicillium sp. IBT 35674x]|nr:hypothetical protein N7451_012424 [Penicillium sp. IBT 35674x]